MIIDDISNSRERQRLRIEAMRNICGQDVAAKLTCARTIPGTLKTMDGLPAAGEQLPLPGLPVMPPARYRRG